MMTAPERFEDRLLRELRQIVANRPAADVVPRRRPQRTHLALGVGITIATAAVAVIATSGSVTPSAYAVEPSSNGTVTVSIHGLSDAAGLQRSLRAAGVPAVVDFAAAGRSGCVAPPADASGSGEQPTLHTSFGHSPGAPESGASSEGPTSSSEPDRSSDPSKVSGPVTAALSGGVQVGRDGVTFTIDPGTIKQGEKVYITTSTGAVSSIGIAVATTAPGPSCAS
jgi:hypothetical protein